MSDQPSYIGMLTAIAVAEHRTHTMLSAWRDATEDRRLAEVLDHVAGVEGAHATMFREHLTKFGVTLEPVPMAEYEQAVGVAVARSPASDEEKFRALLGYTPPVAGEVLPNPFAHYFDDPTIDAETGALLGRFIAEERDSERRLRAEFARILAPADAEPTATNDSQLLADLASSVEELTRLVAELRKRP